MRQRKHAAEPLCSLLRSHLHFLLHQAAQAQAVINICTWSTSRQTTQTVELILQALLVILTVGAMRSGSIAQSRSSNKLSLGNQLEPKVAKARRQSLPD